jgi:hypothetical protein
MAEPGAPADAISRAAELFRWAPSQHDAYAIPRGILPDCARRLSGLPVLFVGVRCPIAAIMERRRTTGYPADVAALQPVHLLDIITI